MLTKEILKKSDQFYKKKLALLHKSFKLPEELIISNIISAVKEKPFKLTRIINGESNEIYLAEFTNLNPLIIKISRSGNNFHKEQWIGIHALEKFLPVARITYITELTPDFTSIYLAIEDYLPGKALNQMLIDNPQEDHFQELIISLGGLISKFHEIELPKNNADLYNLNLKPSWTEFINQGINEPKLTNLFKRLKLVEKYIPKLINLFSKYEEIYTTIKPALLYGDFNPRNVLVADNKITGLIDFENSMIGDPIYDLARWDYFYPFHGFELNLILKGYTNFTQIRRDFDKKLHLYRLHLGITFLDYFLTKDNKLGLRVALDNLLEDLNYFDL